MKDNAVTRIDITIRLEDSDKFETLCDYFDERFENTLSKAVSTVEYRFLSPIDERLGFEHILQANNIPYDKRWQLQVYDAGAEYHRVDAWGQSVVRRFDQVETPLAEVDEHYSNSLDCFHARQHKTFHIISWAEQESVLNRLNHYHARCKAVKQKQALLLARLSQG